MVETTSSNRLKDTYLESDEYHYLSRQFNIASLVVSLVTIVLVCMTSLFVEYNSKSKQVKNYYPFIQRSFNSVEKRELVFQMKNLLNNSFEEILIKRQKGEVFIMMGSSSRLSIPIKMKLFTNVVQGRFNGVAIFSYSPLNNLLMVLCVYLLILFFFFPLILKFKKSSLEKQMNLFELEKQKKIAILADQVAHDIRSPLSALDILLLDDAKLTDEKRVLVKNSVKRIHSIADDLLKKKEQHEIPSLNGSYLISALVRDIVLEKRIELEGRDIEIGITIDKSCSDLICELCELEFKRMLSNLLNNSIEAIEGQKGEISVIISSEERGSVGIAIIDNGKGIPKEVINKLGNLGESHGKVNGTGMGIYHAKKTLEAVGGSLVIESEEGVGSKFTIFLKSSDYIQEIYFNSLSRVAVIDDDQSIHDIWKTRLLNRSVELFHFKNPLDFKKWKIGNKADYYLMDQNFSTSDETGLKLIQELNISDRSVLVTGHSKDPDVLRECHNLKIKILPKENLLTLPIHISTVSILLDDDELVRLNWRISAKANSKDLKIFKTREELFENLALLEKEAIFYLDSNLSDGVLGENIAKELFDLGFYNLYLTTGLEASRFSHLTYLKGVIGKSTPWANS